MEDFSYTSILLWVRVAFYRVKHYLNLPNIYNLTSTPLTVHKGLYAFFIFLFSST